MGKPILSCVFAGVVMSVVVSYAAELPSAAVNGPADGAQSVPLQQQPQQQASQQQPQQQQRLQLPSAQQQDKAHTAGTVPSVPKVEEGDYNLTYEMWANGVMVSTMTAKVGSPMSHNVITFDGLDLSQGTFGAKPAVHYGTLPESVRKYPVMYVYNSE